MRTEVSFQSEKDTQYNDELKKNLQRDLSVLTQVDLGYVEEEWKIFDIWNAQKMCVWLKDWDTGIRKSSEECDSGKEEALLAQAA